MSTVIDSNAIARTTKTPAQKGFSWRTFAILWVACLIGVLAILPYSLTSQGISLNIAQLPLVLLNASIVNGILFAIAAAAGLWLAGRIGLGLPVLEGWLAHQPVGNRIRTFALPAIVVGVIGSVLIIGLDGFVFQPLLKTEFANAAKALGPSSLTPPWWQGLLASLYGGIDEEVLLRLFMMSLLAFVGKFVSHAADGRPTLTVLWIANILAAVLFGLGHLPATAAILPLTPLVILRAVVLNGLLGVAFGYFYYKYGLEAGILSHLSADLVLHVLSAL